MSDSLLAAALTSVSDQPIISYDDYRNCTQSLEKSNIYEELDTLHLYQSNLSRGRVDSIPPANDVFYLYVSTMQGKKIKFEWKPSYTMDRIREKIAAEEGMPKDEIELLFHGRCIDDYNKALSDYSIIPDDVLHMVVKARGGGVPRRPTVFYLHPNLRDPKYDYDFEYMKDDGLSYSRGGISYNRPYGWNRLALKVLGKYENDIWLGSEGNRQFSDDNEWPVSYHGTAKYNCKSIAEDGYLLIKGRRFAFGHGIYSTPDINVAALYASEFRHEGKIYKVVFQNRVNPDTLVKISKKETGVGEYWISPKEMDMRPYGICIKTVTKGLVSKLLDKLKN